MKKVFFIQNGTSAQSDACTNAFLENVIADWHSDTRHLHDKILTDWENAGQEFSELWDGEKPENPTAAFYVNWANGYYQENPKGYMIRAVKGGYKCVLSDAEIGDTYIIFKLDKSCYSDKHKDTLSTKAKKIEEKMMALGFDGALTGHPYQPWENYIYFEL